MTTEPVLMLAPPPGRQGIPMDVFTTLGRLVGYAYPDATIGNGEDGRGYTLCLPAGTRAKRVTKKAAQAAVEPHDPDEPQVDVVGVTEEGTLRATVPQQLVAVLAPIALAMLEETDAPNYVEQTVHHPDTHERVVIIVQKPNGKTPHELRTEADAKAEEARAALRDLVALKDGPRDDHYRAAKEAAWDRARAALEVS